MAEQTAHIRSVIGSSPIAAIFVDFLLTVYQKYQNHSIISLMSYTLMIVDDEHHIRKGLASILNWKEMGFQSVLLASDGVEALEIVAKNKIDLILLDIRMPRLDGIAFLKEYRHGGGDAQCLILSGFPEFEYAQKAIKLQVDGYLLKPIDEDELQALVIKILGNLKTSKSELVIDPNILNYQFFSILKSNNKDTIELEKIAKKLQIELVQWQVLLIKSEKSIHHAPLFAEVKKHSTRLGLKIITDMSNFIAGISLNTYNNGHNTEHLKIILDTILEPLGIRYLVALGCMVDNINDLRESYKLSSSIMDKHFLCRYSHIVWELPNKYYGKKIIDDFIYVRDEVSEKIHYALSIHNYTTVNTCLENCANWLLTHDFSEIEIRKEFALIVSRVGDRIVGQAQPSANSRNALVSVLANMLQTTNIYSLVDLLSRELPLLCEADGPVDARTIITRVKEIVELNYADNLKLESLADVFKYNSAYLGKLFKSRVGVSFKTFLDEVRIRKAKEFLEEGYKVYQVAEMVGFAYVDYFHTKFKKYTGQSPSTWRGEEKKNS